MTISHHRRRRSRRKSRRSSSCLSFSRLLPRSLRRLKRYLPRPLRRRGGLLLVVLLAGIAFWVLRHGVPTFTSTSNNGKYDGIDVSRHQGRIDWKKVASDSHIRFVYLKATEGASHVDSRYAENLRGARGAHLPVGSYHFFLGYKSAREQFENFRRHVSKSEQDLLPMVDVEESGCRGVSRLQLQQRLGEFMELVKAEYGRYPLLYSQYRFYNEKLAPEFNRYFIFMARYSSQEPILRGGGHYNIWQYSERGHIPGISGTVDLDRLANGTSLSRIKLK